MTELLACPPVDEYRRLARGESPPEAAEPLLAHLESCGRCSRVHGVFDAEKVGVTLIDITPRLPATDNFQHWPPCRHLVVETARRVLDYTGGTLVMPMTVLVEQYWREISAGLTHHAIPVRRFVLHADHATLRGRIEAEHPIPRPSASGISSPRPEAARTWLHGEVEVVDNTGPGRQRIAEAVTG